MATNTAKGLKIATFIGANTSKMSIKTATATVPPAPPSPEIELPGGIQVPFIKSKDIAKQLPSYANALQRSIDEYLPAEDLDNVQLELEQLLSSAAMRYRILKCEYEMLDKDERHLDRRAKQSIVKPPAPPAVTTATPIVPGKRKRDEGPAIRKIKHTPTPTFKHTKHGKNAAHGDDIGDYVPPNIHSVHGHARDHQQKMQLPKNDTPNKFWLSVEPYCMPLTNEDLRLLDDLLEQYNGPLVPPIPELGPHYSTVWASDDLKEEQQASSTTGHLSRIKQQHNPSHEMLKKADSLVDDCVTGPLTQRLVSALMEEQLVQNPAEVAAAAIADFSNSSSENTHSSYHSLSHMRNSVDIEKRVKKELLEQGILDSSDFLNNDEDEIHGEIKRLVAELSTLSEYNSHALRRLHTSASDEIKRTEIKRKLDTIDQEILEAYRRAMQTRAKRRQLAPEEQQEIFRLTAEQKALSDQLERASAHINILYE